MLLVPGVGAVVGLAVFLAVIVLGAAEDPAGPPPPDRHGRPEPPHHEGPPRFPRRHLSPTVRFVVDHAPCDVLLLYAGKLRTAT
ncbi:MAG TPA: hypothetical protein VKT83_19285 [bacterium]|nr:hypothetical protein [bacterium]